MPALRALCHGAAVVLLGVLCSACESLPQKVQVDFAPLPPTPVATSTATPARPATGSLFQTASYRPSFEDRRARMVGDTITIQIIENVSASQKSSSTANRSSSMDAGVTAFPGAAASLLPKLTVGTSSANDFSGEGATASANTFSTWGRTFPD